MQRIFADHYERVNEAAKGFTISVEHLLQQGFNIFRKAPAELILYGIFYLLVSSNPVTGIILGGPATMGFYILARKIDRGEKISINDFTLSFNMFFPLLALNLLMWILISLGLLLLIIPGIYLAVSFIFSWFFVWFYDVESAEALRLSKKLVSGNLSQVFVLCLVLFGLLLLGSLAFGVGVLLAVPLVHLVIYAAFNDLIGFND